MVVAWDARDVEVIKKINLHENWITTIDYNPRFNLLLITSLDKKISLWDVDSWEMFDLLQDHFGGVRRGFFTRDGRSIISADRRGNVINWSIDLESGKSTRLHGKKIHQGSIWSITQLGDMELIATGSYDKTVKISTLEDLEVLTTINLRDSVASHLHYLEKDQTLLISTMNGEVMKWDLQDDMARVRTRVTTVGGINDVVVVPEKNLAVMALDDGTIKLLDLDELLVLDSMNASNYPISRLLLDDKKEFLYCVGWDGVFRSWYLETGEQFDEIKLSDKYLFDLAFSKKHLTLVAGGYDKNLYKVILEKHVILGIITLDQVSEKVDVESATINELAINHHEISTSIPLDKASRIESVVNDHLGTMEEALEDLSMMDTPREFAAKIKIQDSLEESKKTTIPSQQTLDSPHVLESIRGIGKKTAEQLYNAGIFSIQDLIEADPEQLSKKILQNTGKKISIKKIISWQQAGARMLGIEAPSLPVQQPVITAETSSSTKGEDSLLSIPGIGKKTLDKLALVNVYSIEDLATQDVKLIHEAFMKQGLKPISLKKLASFQLEAKRLLGIDVTPTLQARNIDDLPGIGAKTRKMFEALGISTIEELANMDVNEINKKSKELFPRPLSINKLIKFKNLALAELGKPIVKETPIEAKPFPTLEEVQGIGKTRAKQLESIGINDPVELARKNLNEIIDLYESNNLKPPSPKILAKMIENSRTLLKTRYPELSPGDLEPVKIPGPEKTLDLLEIKGVGKKTKEMLVKIGIETVPHLVKFTPEEIFSKMNKHFEKPLTLKKIEKIIDNARKLVETGS